jgi:hypothetical protein
MFRHSDRLVPRLRFQVKNGLRLSTTIVYFVLVRVRGARKPRWGRTAFLPT